MNLEQPTNPCNDYARVQVQMMQHLRKRAGQPLMTLVECAETEALLQRQIDEAECKDDHTII